MGFLDKLWDDHIGGPRPEKGLGRLREPAGLPDGFDIDQSPIDTRSPRTSSEFLRSPRASSDFQQQDDEARRITQSISIKKPSALQTGGEVNELAVSPAAGSPMASSPMMSPASQGKDNVWRSVFHPGQNKSMKKMGSNKFDNVPANTGSPSERTPSVYDWVVISALEK